MGSAFEDVAETADAVAEEQREIAHRARLLHRQHERGASLASLLDSDGGRGFGDLLRRSARRAAGAATRFGAAMARNLSAEGESRRQIARRLGVTHQRVSAILRGSKADGE